MDSRERWNQRHATGAAPGPEPSAALRDLAGELPTHGRALDVAGGAGRHALWLARRGLDVTLVDVSDVAVELAGRGDPRPGTLTALRRDLEEEALPAGPWDLILVSHYLQRSLFEALAAALAPGGLLVYVQPTRRNLERHARPGPAFLVEEGELRAAFEDRLEIIRYDEGWTDEGWTDEGRHEARLLARARP